MKRLTDRLAPLLSELQSNPRLKAGSAVIAALLLSWLWMVIADWRELNLRELDEANEKIVRMEALSSESIWVERAARALELRTALEAEIVAVDSPGLGQAAFQTLLTRAFDSLGIRPQLSMEPPMMLESPVGIIRISATLSGSATPQEVTELLRRIESERQLIVVPLLQIRSEANETFQMTVHAYYRLNTEAST